jgi:hypothetical protein
MGRDIAPSSLNFGTKCRWVVSFTPEERALVTLWRGGWVSPGLDAVPKRNYTELIHGEISCEDVNWIEMVQDCA